MQDEQLQSGAIAADPNENVQEEIAQSPGDVNLAEEENTKEEAVSAE